ncbi:MAG: translation initiation factor IF-3 [Candidatus Shapirobacteria bacterium]|nr:translation initiation factor IF-3 [Candidatus Shapirobacteria bacterium]
MGSKQNFNRKYYKINHYISAPTVRLLDETGKQIDVMSISEARTKAMETGLDLVEISANAKPPVVKLISFSKFKYQEAKKLKSEKKGTKGGGLKEIQMSPFIGLNDYNTRVKKAQHFLTTGNKVKLSIKFHGRQIAHKEFGYNLVEKFKNDLKEISIPEGEARLMGKILFFTLSPSKKKVVNKNEETKQETKN